MAKTESLPLRERLQRISSYRFVGPVPVEHTFEAQYVSAPDGSQWVAKLASVTGHNQLLAEAISYQLAQALCLPVPKGAIGGEGETLAWLSLTSAGCSRWTCG